MGLASGRQVVDMNIRKEDWRIESTAKTNLLTAKNTATTPIP